MNKRKEFLGIMREHKEIALSTAANDIANVRIVNFYFDENTNTIYFTSLEAQAKVKEFQINNKVAFTTIPCLGKEHIKARGIVKKSEKSIFDLSDKFISKYPNFKEKIEKCGEYLVLFEISFKEAIVTIDFENIFTIEF